VTSESTDGTGSGAGELRSALASLVRPPRRRQVAVLLLGTAFAAALCWFAGMDAWHAGTVGLVLAAAGLCAIAVPDHRDAAWPEVAGPDGEGARWDVARLSWSLRPKRGRIPQAGLVRVQELARHRLALRGLDLADPDDRAAIERLIGTAAYATVALPAARPPRVRAVVHCLDMLDRLDPSLHKEDLV
jgi:hypothetical protein